MSKLTKIQVNRKFDDLSEISLSEKFRKSADWRYKYIQTSKFEEHISPFKVMNVLTAARNKKCEFRDKVLSIGPCKTETSQFVRQTESQSEEDQMDETILRIASFACMVDEVNYYLISRFSHIDP